MKTYTKTGDNGTTSLIGGERVLKCDLRVEAYGTIDELIAHIGLLNDLIKNNDYNKLLTSIQSKLMICSSVLASNNNSKITIDEITEDNILAIEDEIDKINVTLPKLTNFIIPGGHITVSTCHITRTICRRAERCVVRINNDKRLLIIIKYLNRLSDLFFVLSRKLLIDLKE